MSLKSKAIKGVKWTSTFTIVQVVTSLVKVGILTRILDQKEFGLMAIVMFIHGLFYLLSELGVSVAILHKQRISRQEYTSLYWLNFFTALGICGIIYFIAPLAEHFYKMESLANLIRLMSVALIFSAIGNQFKIIEQKRLNFKTIAIYDFIAIIISFIVAVVLAYNGYGVLALVYSVIAQIFVSNLLFLIRNLPRLKNVFHFSFNETKPFIKIGIYDVLGQIINFFNKDLDILIIGKFFSPEILGGYSLAKQLVMRPSQIINPVLSKVASPTLAKLQHNVAELKKNYLKLLSIIFNISFPLYLVFIIAAPLIVTILYGEKLIDIVPIVRILSVYMIFRAVGNPVGSLLIATGKTKIGFYWNIFATIIVALFIYCGSFFGIIGVSLCIVILGMFLYYPNWLFVIKPIINSSFKEQLSTLIPKVSIFKSIFLNLLNKK